MVRAPSRAELLAAPQRQQRERQQVFRRLPVDGTANPSRANVAPSPLRASLLACFRKPIISVGVKVSQVEMTDASPVWPLDDSAIV